MKLAELIHDMSKLNVELSDFEHKFGVKSPEFYQAITAGELEEFEIGDRPPFMQKVFFSNRIIGDRPHFMLMKGKFMTAMTQMAMLPLRT